MPTTAEKIAQLTGDLPAAPSAVMRALAIARDPESTVADLEAVVGTDPGLAARLLRVANSAYYRRTREVLSLSHAILTLGFRTVLSLTLASGTKSVFDGAGRVSHRIRETLWDHAISTAFVAGHLGRKVGSGADAELCFVGGLLHDIGKLVVARGFPVPFAEVLATVERGDEEPDHVEERILGFHHAELGAAVAGAWELPDPLVRVIRHHHEPGVTNGNEVEAAIVGVADHLVTRMGWNFPNPRLAAAERLPAAGRLALPPGFEETCISEVRGHVEELKSAF